jgi:hypothetical protein
VLRQSPNPNILMDRHCAPSQSVVPGSARVAAAELAQHSFADSVRLLRLAVVQPFPQQHEDSPAYAPVDHEPVPGLRDRHQIMVHASVVADL